MNSPAMQYIIDNERFLKKLIRKFVLTHDAADDVYQNLAEATLLYCKHLKLNEQEMSNYMGRVMMNCINAHLVKNKLDRERHTTCEEDEEDENGIQLTFQQMFATHLETCKDPLLLIIDDEDLKTIQKLIDKVANPEHNAVLTLLYVEGMKPKAVAKHLGISYANIRKIIQRFRDEVT